MPRRIIKEKADLLAVFFKKNVASEIKSSTFSWRFAFYRKEGDRVWKKLKLLKNCLLNRKQKRLAMHTTAR